ncbi:MAG: 16S rRNA (guanine(966)-N(2))-methyltransferase RsmD [Cytophagaceae bacterium]|nr:16S rRNA (guanine(966)-N(2))-methyltransferase RsmD [Gemmatimonadaceae bacterium]
MRIIAGAWRGRTISAPPNEVVRPTADRAREAWMSMLHHELPDARVVDLFAGSGSLGLEALSRGAESCDFVELSSSALKSLRDNAAKLGAGARATIHRADALEFVQGKGPDTWDLAFADPPYNLGLGAQLATLWLEQPFSRILSVEHHAEEEMPPASDRRSWGTTGVSIYRQPSSSRSGER